MATIRFTANLRRHVDCPTLEVAGTTLRDVLEDYFRDHARVRDYILDEQGRMRRHMSAFIDGRQVRDRDGLSDEVPAGGTVDIIQSLSGG